LQTVLAALAGPLGRALVAQIAHPVLKTFAGAGNTAASAKTALRTDGCEMNARESQINVRVEQLSPAHPSSQTQECLNTIEVMLKLCVRVHVPCAQDGVHLGTSQLAPSHSAKQSHVAGCVQFPYRHWSVQMADHVRTTIEGTSPTLLAANTAPAFKARAHSRRSAVAVDARLANSCDDENQIEMDTYAGHKEPRSIQHYKCMYQEWSSFPERSQRCRWLNLLVKRKTRSTHPEYSRHLPILQHTRHTARLKSCHHSCTLQAGSRSHDHILACKWLQGQIFA
jgi:hypothetical protein